MSTGPTPLAGSPGHELHSIRDQWWCFLAMGIALIVMGLVCMSAPVFATIVSVMLLGYLMAAAGIVQIVTAFWSGKWSGMLLHLLIGVLYTIVGLMVADAPVENSILLTKMIAIFLIVTGVFNIVASLLNRFHRWGWVMVNGCVTLLLGMLINRQWSSPGNALWVIGLFVGIEMIFNGWGWIALAIGLKASKNPYPNQFS